jgi:hypothetical protein
MDLLCEKDDCENEATFRYRWPWGDEGVVCDYHAVTTQQLAQQLGREPALVSLGHPTPSPPAADAPHPEFELAKQMLLEKDAELVEVKGHRDRLAIVNMALMHELGKLKGRQGSTTDPELHPADPDPKKPQRGL